jgi:hypothetical protein
MPRIMGNTFKWVPPPLSSESSPSSEIGDPPASFEYKTL